MKPKGAGVLTQGEMIVPQNYPSTLVPFQQKAEHESDVNLDSSSRPGRQCDSQALETAGGDKGLGVGTRSSLISLLAPDPEEGPPRDVQK